MRHVKRGDVTGPVWSAIEKHRTNYIYWGCIAVDKIIGKLPFAKEWLDASNVAAAQPNTENRDIKFRIYRDVASLRDYTTKSIKDLKVELIA